MIDQWIRGWMDIMMDEWIDILMDGYNKAWVDGWDRPVTLLNRIRSGQ